MGPQVQHDDGGRPHVGLEQISHAELDPVLDASGARVRARLPDPLGIDVHSHRAGAALRGRDHDPAVAAAEVVHHVVPPDSREPQHGLHDLGRARLVGNVECPGGRFGSCARGRGRARRASGRRGGDGREHRERAENAPRTREAPSPPRPFAALGMRHRAPASPRESRSSGSTTPRRARNLAHNPIVHRAIQEPAHRGEDDLLLALEVRLEVALELRGGPADDRRQRREPPGLARELLAGADELRERGLVLGVLARHVLERRVHGGIEPAEARQDRVLLVAGVQRQRLREVAAHAGGGLGDGGDVRRPGLGDPAREREERPDALVTLEQQVDGVAGSCGRSDAGEHCLASSSAAGR